HRGLRYTARFAGSILELASWLTTLQRETTVARAVLKRQNLMVDEGKLCRLRRALSAGGKSEAVRIAVDRELAITLALQELTERGTWEDVFNRASAGRKWGDSWQRRP